MVHTMEGSKKSDLLRISTEARAFIIVHKWTVVPDDVASFQISQNNTGGEKLKQRANSSKMISPNGVNGQMELNKSNKVMQNHYDFSYILNGPELAVTNQKEDTGVMVKM